MAVTSERSSMCFIYSFGPPAPVHMLVCVCWRCIKKYRTMRQKLYSLDGFETPNWFPLTDVRLRLQLESFEYEYIAATLSLQRQFRQPMIISILSMTP